MLMILQVMLGGAYRLVSTSWSPYPDDPARGAGVR